MKNLLRIFDFIWLQIKIEAEIVSRFFAEIKSKADSRVFSTDEEEVEGRDLYVFKANIQKVKQCNKNSYFFCLFRS